MCGRLCSMVIEGGGRKSVTCGRYGFSALMLALRSTGYVIMLVHIHTQIQHAYIRGLDTHVLPKTYDLCIHGGMLPEMHANSRVGQMSIFHKSHATIRKQRVLEF